MNIRAKTSGFSTGLRAQRRRIRTQLSANKKQSRRKAVDLPKNPSFSESFAKVASGIQSLAVVIGLLIGGWWALTTFVFQNPAFNEGGLEVAGFEPELIKTELSIEPLDLKNRAYEVTLTITNLSQTLHQLVIAEDV